ncbi:MAG: DUF1349 domain-containing protein [Bryobacterales bacterium]|nr:DUF1349 domain-containing protein [Bryobacterales bacterium]
MSLNLYELGNLNNAHWFNPPTKWRMDKENASLIVEPDGATDFWQRTHYGFSADSGHFLGTDIDGDFTMTTTVRFFPAHQYDQAGLMLRATETCWIKTSVEYEPESSNALGAVVTNDGYSDWSFQPFPAAQDCVRLRLSLVGRDVLVDFSLKEDEDWTPLRIAHLHAPENVSVKAGIYACSPKGHGFRAEFTEFELLSKTL